MCMHPESPVLEAETNAPIKSSDFAFCAEVARLGFAQMRNAAVNASLSNGAQAPMRRRQFILFAGAVVASPLAGRAQQPARPLIGFLHSGAPGAYVSQMSAFRQSLKGIGYIEGQNLVIEYRWAEDQMARLPVLAANWPSATLRSSLRAVAQLRLWPQNQ